MNKIIACLIALCLFLPGIGNSQKLSLKELNELIFSVGKREDCNPSKSGSFYDNKIMSPKLQSIEPDSNCMKRFSRRSINIAASIGAITLLNQYSFIEPKAKTSDSAKLALLFIRQEIDERLNMSLLNITSILAEIDCDEEKTIEMKGLLDQKLARKNSKLTVGSIIIGGGVGIITATLSLATPDKNTLIQSLAIGGSFVSTMLAIRQLRIGTSANLSHKRNYIHEMWTDTGVVEIYTPDITHFITKKFKMNDTLTNGKKIVQKRMTEFGISLPTEKMNDKTVLIMSQGGNYTPEDLQVRISLLGIVKSEINLMKYDLKRLHQEILMRVVTEE